ncbi:Fic family protein [Nocardia africana]|uniref:Protein involved in cell division n=1 Tax=Nocardia africana TaxID=134964 RepID=A0A378X248_9NOCA|nr:Fic family protein [Nocardia africana]MCC3311505.1 Fic family protein [Nocardia africana]SUA47232.1 Protein involved in cell division [Nocardia africana]
MGSRKFETTHPWITFEIDLRRLNHRIWLLLGEAMSKCSHIAGTALQPHFAELLNSVYLSKGIHGTTAIEGNTLSEDEVRERITSGLSLPKSREYLGREIDNILSVSNDIIGDVVNKPELDLSGERICDFNRRLLQGLPLKEGVVPGAIREHSVTVGGYRGAPAEDCAYLLDRLADWLNSLRAPDGSPELRFPIAVLKAILAHLYIAWIHPFGDGNGRTARLIELQLMIQAGAPVPAAHLLSDHYNRTRDAYYVELDRTSRADGHPIEGFIEYALQGFVDELREQIQTVRAQQYEVTWRDLVHDTFRDEDTPARVRQRHLVLDMEPGKWYTRNEIRSVSTRVAMEYAGKEAKTVSRDLNALRQRDLIVNDGHQRYMANRGIIAAFMPPVALVEDP